MLDGMRVRLCALVFWLLTVFAATACPVCTYNRLLAEHWHVKYFLVNLIVPLAFVANRLDIVRALYALIAYVLFSLQIHSFLLWHTFPGAAPNWLSELAGEVAGWVWGLNVIGIALLYLLSRSRFFRRDKERGLAFWQPLAYGVTMLFVNLLIGLG